MDLFENTIAQYFQSLKQYKLNLFQNTDKEVYTFFVIYYLQKNLMSKLEKIIAYKLSF